MHISATVRRIVGALRARTRRSAVQASGDVVVNLQHGAQHVRICQGGREWVVFYDIAQDEFVAQPVKKAC